ncbi:type IV conjugative transfer system protein TraL [Pseudomonas sp. F1_0610]|uniref:type IV conjugative transfer system protein TraL n=1 Tax=Pseudomonas sp. F1_0610 TaxID=3114284 RepID=UPI0039C37B62
MEPVSIPSYIDAPPHFLLWSADEMAPILLGLVTTKLYRRFRDGRPDGFILHAIYWAGLLPTKAKTIPNPFIRSYLP